MIPPPETDEFDIWNETQARPAWIAALCWGAAFLIAGMGLVVFGLS
jgi:hypothetical protein